MRPAIKVESLSKYYRLGQNRGCSYKTVRESLASAGGHLLNRLRRRSSPHLSKGDFHALNDVSFSVQPGEVVGIVGRNGAGKSTLLKILSRIVEPSSGRAVVQGRIGSLLEVGTGFHPELTGRENIYLNGAILGMKREEINRKFDEIVDFSEIEKFLDTPVKRYSSGMYVRLAFAVAAHLEPEILIIDEVLAVGDMAFQKKCMGKMDAVGRSGRTILFVSHNMAAVEGLCQRAIVLDAGSIDTDGPVSEAVTAYHRVARNDRARDGYKFIHHDRPHMQDLFQITEVWVTSENEVSPHGFPTGAPLEFHLRCKAPKPITHAVPVIRLFKLGGGAVTKLHAERSGAAMPDDLEGDFTITCSVRDLYLGPGDYTIRVGLKSNNSSLDLIDDAATFTILPTDFYGTGRGPDPGDGCVVCRPSWTVQPSTNNQRSAP